MKHLLPTIMLLYLALATTYSLVTPLGEGPDEPGHAAYVFFLAREWRLPVQCAAPCRGEVPGEGHQPPLAYALATPALLWLPRGERSFDLPSNRRFVWAGGAEPNAVAHGSREYWPWRGAVLGWHLARLVNVAIGALTVAVVWVAGRRLLGVRSADMGAALVALNPQFLFTSGLLTNDALLTLLCALLLWLMASQPGAQGGGGYRRALAVGVALGLALITKQSALLLLPIAGLWCLLDGRTRNQEPRAMGGDPITRLLPAAWRAGIVFGSAGAIAGWWYLRNLELYGDPLALGVFQAEFVTQAFEASKPDAWAGALATLYESFWARFGWMNIVPPPWVSWLYALLALLALAGLAMRARRRAGHDRIAGRWLLAAFPLLTLAWQVSFALTAGLVAWQGRLLFPALPALALLLGHGLTGLSSGGERPDRWPGWARGEWLLAGVMLLLAAWMPLGVIRPAYPFQTLPAAEAVRRIATPVYARFAARPDERGAELRSVRIDGEARPGETLTVTLIWHALGRQNRAWEVFIHLVDDQETILAEDNRHPRDGKFWMSQWVAGDWVEDPHPLRLPADLPAGTYRLWVGLWYPDTGRRAGRYSAGERLLGDYLEVGTVTVTR